MNLDLSRCRTVCATLLPATLWLPQQVAAIGFSSTSTTIDSTHIVKQMAECESFELKETISDGTARTRTYWLQGICKTWVIHIKGGKPQDKTSEVSLFAEARATWHSDSSRLEETVKLSAADKTRSGTLRSTFKCLGDPVAQNVSCVQLEFKNLTDWSGFAVPIDKNRPLSQGAASMAAVAQVAKSTRRMSSPSAKSSTAAQPGPSSGASTSTDTSARANTAAAAAAIGSVSPAAAAPLPDLTSGVRAVVAGKHSGASGAMLALPDTDARVSANGVCQVAFEHEIRNVGAADSPASDRRWTRDGTPGSLVAATPAIAAGAAVTRIDTIGLRPGVNKLRLQLDPLGQIAEVNEANNDFVLTVSVSGLCAGVAPSSPQAAATDSMPTSQDGAASAAQRRLRLPSASR